MSSLNVNIITKSHTQRTAIEDHKDISNISWVLIHTSKLLDYDRGGGRAGDEEAVRDKTVKGGGNDLHIPQNLSLLISSAVVLYLMFSVSVKNIPPQFVFEFVFRCVCVFLMKCLSFFTFDTYFHVSWGHSGTPKVHTISLSMTSKDIVK